MPVEFTAEDDAAARELIHLALQEDLAEAGDITSTTLIPSGTQGQVHIVARRPGILAGLPLVERVFAAIEPPVEIHEVRQDGESIQSGDIVATLSGSVHALLAGERTALNFLTHLSGVATLTHQFVEAVVGTSAVILDTRKTFPGYRRLQKYAVRCGGGTNHRMGLYDAILIKDNHLAAWSQTGSPIAEAVRYALDHAPPGRSVEVEVDSLAQFEQVLPLSPAIILLDNMPPSDLRTAVALRNACAPSVLLEASGGVTLSTIRPIAETGIDRISLGTLTHSAPALDLAFDWSSNP